jgi:predicted dehydrogenase
MPQPIEAVMIGAGGRGYGAYGNYALRYPHQIKFIAVVEPIAERRERFAREHSISAERQFVSWEDLYARSQMAPALVNCTMDRSHVASTLPALAMGYDVLLEKPMAVNHTTACAWCAPPRRPGACSRSVTSSATRPSSPPYTRWCKAVAWAM